MAVVICSCTTNDQKAKKMKKNEVVRRQQKQSSVIVNVLFFVGFFSSLLSIEFDWTLTTRTTTKYGVVEAIDFIPRRPFGRFQKQQQQAMQDAAAAAEYANMDTIDPVVTTQQQNFGAAGLAAHGKRKIAAAANEVIRRATTRGGGGFAIAGTFAGIRKHLGTVNWSLIRTALYKAFDIADIVALTTIGWLTEPIVRHYYKLKHHKRRKKVNLMEEYEDSYWYKTANVIQELGRLGSFMYGVDMISIIIRKLGFSVSPELNSRIGQTSIALWTASRVRRLKQIWMYKIMKQHPEGRAAWISRILDGGLVVVLFFFIHDIFQVTIGKGLQSIAAVGGLSTIVFSLAAKDFAQMLIAGIAIYNSDKFYEGDKVRFGDGTTGKIDHQGAFELHIRGSDGIITRIPNIQIINQRVQNLSRTHNSTIKQTLWFKYEDINRLPAVMESIKDEIRSSCPKLIDDGSRSFQAMWTDYKHDHLEVEVEASFTISPIDDEYDTNKQTVLMAIARAVEKNNVQFAIPTSLCLSKEIPA